MEATFFQRFEAACRAQNTSPNAVAKAVGASSGSVTAWKNGAAPRNATLAKLADHLGVSTDYLLGKESADILQKTDIAFYGDYQSLTEEQKDTLRDMARLMLERRRNKE